VYPSAAKGTLALVSTARWLLMLHVTGAFSLVAGSVAAGIFNVLAIRSERPSDAAYLLRLVKYAVIAIGIGVVTTLVLGIWLWHHQGYGIDAWWIWAAVVLWAASGALGGRGGRHQEKARELAERLSAQGDTSTEELRAILRDPKGNALSWLAGAATLGVLILMIWKPGA
jgi:uncharacterized membrane protein